MKRLTIFRCIVLTLLCCTGASLRAMGESAGAAYDAEIAQAQAQVAAALVEGADAAALQQAIAAVQTLADKDAAYLEDHTAELNSWLSTLSGVHALLASKANVQAKLKLLATLLGDKVITRSPGVVEEFEEAELGESHGIVRRTFDALLHNRFVTFGAAIVAGWAFGRYQDALASGVQQMAQGFRDQQSAGKK